MTTETHREKSTTEQHDAYRALRRAAQLWLNKVAQELEVIERLEDLLPDFVRRRYIIGTVYRWERTEGKAHGAIELAPVDIDKDDVKAADALHADVGKLFDWLVNKRPEVEQGDGSERPARGLTEYNGTIHYEFFLTGLPGFESGLRVTINGLPPGSACHITKKVTGTKVVEVVEYEMVCDDELGISPEEHAEEAEREAVQ